MLNASVAMHMCKLQRNWADQDTFDIHWSNHGVSHNVVWCVDFVMIKLDV